jgi:hypothetical protein
MDETKAAYMELRKYGIHLTSQQHNTIKGQIKSGNITAAMKGLDKVLKRRGI